MADTKIKYIPVDKLITEIERFRTTEYDGNTLGDDVANGALDYVLEEIIPSLQQEQEPAELEQLAKLRDMTHEIREVYERGIEIGLKARKSIWHNVAEEVPTKYGSEVIVARKQNWSEVYFRWSCN